MDFLLNCEKMENPINNKNNDIYKHNEFKGSFIQLNKEISKFRNLPNWIQNVVVAQ